MQPTLRDILDHNRDVDRLKRLINLEDNAAANYNACRQYPLHAARYLRQAKLARKLIEGVIHHLFKLPNFGDLKAAIRKAKKKE